MARNDSLRKGNNIEMLILSILSTEDCYGYQLSLLIKDYSQGKISLPEGSLYPALYKVVDNGRQATYPCLLSYGTGRKRLSESID